MKPLDKFLELKVYKNSKNGQALVLLPKKLMKVIPDKVRIVKW